MRRVVAVLETYWNWRDLNRGETIAPAYFQINRENYSGKRLYRFVGPDAKLLVTNACSEIVAHAAKHGKPDPAWLATNLRYLDTERMPGFDVLLVCGRVARSAYKSCSFVPSRARVITINHPAARTWSNAQIEATARNAQGVPDDPTADSLAMRPNGWGLQLANDE